MPFKQVYAFYLGVAALLSFGFSFGVLYLAVNS